MAILLDISQNIISNVMMSPEIKKGEVDSLLIKHMVINSVLAAKKKFGAEYGQLIVCCDSPRSWRKDVFKHYKASRGKSRSKSIIDWNEIFTVVKEMKIALRENFPYKVIEANGAEADDVIAVLCKHILPRDERILIIGSDKDYVQLQSLGNVTQYNPTTKKFMQFDDPDAQLKELIIRGDGADGIPNIKSDSDTLVTEGKRQPSIFDKDVVHWVKQEHTAFCSTTAMLENYQRNKTLIDFDCIPGHVIDAVKEENAKPILGSQGKIIQYFIDNRMKNLMQYSSEF